MEQILIRDLPAGTKAALRARAAARRRSVEAEARDLLTTALGGPADPRQGATLRRWFDDRVLPAFDDRALPFDLSAARVLAAIRVPEHAPLDDALIAAVAHSRQMTVATRNTRHFLALGVASVDPWNSEPPA